MKESLNKLSKEQIEKLYKSGMIKDGTYQKLVQKFADGGTVQEAPMTPINPQAAIDPSKVSVGIPALDKVLNDPNAMSAVQDSVAAKEAAQPTPEMQQYQMWNDFYKRDNVNLPDQVRENMALSKVMDMKQDEEAAAQKKTDSNQSLISQIEANNELRSKLGMQPLPIPANLQGQANPQGSSSPGQGSLHLEKVSDHPPSVSQDPMSVAGSNLMGGLDQAYAQMAQGAARGAQAGAAEAAAESTYMNKMQREYEQMRHEQALVEKNRQTKVDQMQQKYDSVVSDFMNKSNVDPNKWWGERTTGQKIAAAIGVALGGNDAMGIIKDAINRDIDSQKSQIEKGKFAISAQQSVFKMMLDTFGDQRQAELATRSALLQGTELKLKQIAAQYKSPQVLAAAQQTLGQIQLQLQQNKMEIFKNFYANPLMRSEDNAIKTIARIPDETMKKEALKQYGDFQKNEQVKSGIESSMQDIFDNRRAIPGTQGASKAEAARAKILSLTNELFHGKSEAEFGITKEMMPKVQDDPKTFGYKMDSLIQKVESQQDFSLIRGLGITPKKLNLKRN
jgi:hypothetical protein